MAMRSKKLLGRVIFFSQPSKLILFNQNGCNEINRLKKSYYEYIDKNQVPELKLETIPELKLDNIDFAK